MEELYSPPEKYLVINDDDPDLMQIEIPLPQCGDITKIDGYGLALEEQLFIKPIVPERLIELEQNPQLFIDKKTLESNGMLLSVKSFLEENYHEWKEEIDFIESEWGKRLNGYWFYNNGVPTYITGTNYLYISYWEIDIGVPEYRSRDRKFFIFADFCVKDKDSFGFIYPKHRREGATNKAQVWLYETTSRMYRKHSGIQSATEEHAKDVFTDHLVPGWKSLPFFFKPLFQGSDDPKKTMLFRKPASKSSVIGRLVAKAKALGSKIDFKSSDIKGYDSRKLLRYHSDESGKFTDGDILLRHNVVKQCLSTGRVIVGKAAYTSTVGEMDKGGGSRFKQLCDQSHYDHWQKDKMRTKNGRTLSGLYNLFIPAHDGLEGFIDKFGNSLMDEAKQYLQNTREGYIAADDFDGLSEFIRMYPTMFRECFRGDSSKCKFNIKIIEERIDEVTFSEKAPTTKGNFKWKDNVPDTEVVWEPNPRGKFDVSMLLEKGDRNKFFIDNGLKIPGNTNRFTGGADPFKFIKTSNGKRSQGSGAVFQRHDSSIDNSDKDVSEWVTNKFVCRYNFRPMTKNEYGEDMLMMAIYYGFELNVEINVPFLWDYFVDRNYPAYLWYGKDRRTGIFNKKPGTFTTEITRDEIFREIQTYIEKHGYREDSIEFLRQCLEIEEKMTDYDLFVAYGLALIQAKGDKVINTVQQEELDVNLFDEFDYPV